MIPIEIGSLAIVIKELLQVQEDLEIKERMQIIQNA